MKFTFMFEVFRAVEDLEIVTLAFVLLHLAILTLVVFSLQVVTRSTRIMRV
jgi:hypothetical protein